MSYEEDIKRWFNGQVNYYIIERAWHIKGNKIQQLFDILGTKKNIYSKIRTNSDDQPVNLDTLWNSDKYNLSALGLSYEVMTGRTRIEVEGITEKDWKDYIELRYGENKDNPNRKKEMEKFRKKLDSLLREIKVDKLNKSDVGKLIYFCTYHEKSDRSDIVDKEMYELNICLQNITFKNMKNCNFDLQKQVLQNLKQVYGKLNTIIKYQEMKKEETL